MRDDRWYQAIQTINSDYFKYPWGEHLDRLNKTLGLEPKHQFMTPGPGLPPAWFNGDIEHLPANNWVLVISHNPHINHLDRKTMDWYTKQGFDAEGWWCYWSTFNRDSPHWPKKHLPPITRLAAKALGEPHPEGKVRSFAHSRLLLAELCPYASEKWGLSPDQTIQLTGSDIGFQLAARVRRDLIRAGSPRMILVQGSAVLADISSVEADHLQWTKTEVYPSLQPTSSKSRKMYWHLEGHYDDGARSIPIFGFNKIVRPRGPQALVDIDYLGERMREYAERLEPATDGSR